ncbi:MAG: acetyltransferase [Candidatus Margulisbacteria bacterium]|jgi:sugar O-acyltransferase (sialic acid O-acetyltransferase NeuD family)|nr:acetyltransferase [Candidatus Margulisiibacteriota bacterium]
MKKVVIVGTDLFGELAYEYFSKDSSMKVAGFAAEIPSIKKEQFGLPVCPLDEIDKIFPPEEYFAFAAQAYGQLNYRRARLFQKLKKFGYHCATYQSAGARVWPNVQIGENCIILDNVIVQPFSKIGDNVFLMGSNYVGHGAEVKDHVYVAPHALILAGVEVGEHGFIGANSTIANGIKIAKDNYIGMGSLINKNTKENEVYTLPVAVLSKAPAKKFCRVEA